MAAAPDDGDCERMAMISWIATRLFYAVVFFLLGVWAATVSPNFKHMMRQATHAGAEGFEKMREWTSATLDSSSDAAKPATTPAPAPAPAPPAASSQPQNADLLIRAREAFARKDMIGAINAYRDYIDRNPGAIEARGELGNVYFATGRTRDAAKIYAEAAILQIEAGDVAAAQALSPAVRQADATIADELDKRIAEARRPKN